MGRKLGGGHQYKASFVVRTTVEILAKMKHLAALRDHSLADEVREAVNAHLGRFETLLENAHEGSIDVKVNAPLGVIFMDQEGE